MDDAVLRIDRVTKRFGTTTAVRSVSIDIPAKEFFALLGPSGSGKTTLLRIIAGLEVPDEGRVVINGIDVTRQPPYTRGIGMVFQDFMLFPHKRVGENIVFPLRMQGLSRGEQDERLRWAVDLLHLEGLEDRYPSQLSGGQQQRVALARGLIARPVLLLLDEPLANLDRELRKEMEVEVRRYQLELEIPFIYVTHNQEEALTMSDRIAVMNEGSFEQVAPKHEVYTHPESRFVAGFVGHSNRLHGRLTACEKGRGMLDWMGIGVEVPVPSGLEIGDQVECLVKCEKFSVCRVDDPRSESATNTINGRLRDVIFKGAGVDYQVVAPNGQEITISAGVGSTELQAGDDVRVTWTASDSHCFAVPDAGP